MKKIICILAVFLLFIGLDYSYAKETKVEDYEIVQTSSTEQEQTIVSENGNTVIFKINDKYGIKYKD